MEVVKMISLSRDEAMVLDMHIGSGDTMYDPWHPIGLTDTVKQEIILDCKGIIRKSLSNSSVAIASNIIKQLRSI